MLPFYTFNNNLIMGILICSFYIRMTKTESTKSIYKWCIPIIIATYMFLTYNHIVEPLRTIIGCLILGGLIRLWLKRVNWAALTLATSFYFIAWIVSLLIWSITTSDDNLNLFYIVGIAIDTIMLFIFLKFPKMKNGVSHIETRAIKGIIFCIVGMLFTLYGGICAYPNIEIMDFPQAYKEVLAIALLLFSAFATAAFLWGAWHFLKEHRENLAKDEQLVESEKTIEKLQDKCHENYELYKGERAANHKYKDLIPTLSEFSAELADEFANDSIDSLIDVMQLPSGYSALGLYLKGKARECESKGISFDCDNTASDKAWETCGEKKKLVFLITNLLSNAIKELEQTDVKGKQIRLEFMDLYGIFALEISDNAHEFSAEVLSKLGERNNSTNGTGDGFAEIFALLKENKASLIIKENQYQGECFKSISIVFDGKNRVELRTSYRYDELLKVLKSTYIEVKETA